MLCNSNVIGLLACSRFVIIIMIIIIIFIFLFPTRSAAMAMATASAFYSLRFSLRTQHRQHKHKHVVRVSKANTHCQSCSCTLARCRHCRLFDRTHTAHTHTHARIQARSGHSLTRLQRRRRNNCAIKKGWYEAETHKLPAVRVRWLYNTQFSSGELCAASARRCLCVCVRALRCVCVPACLLESSCARMCSCVRACAIAANCAARAQARSLAVHKMGPSSRAGRLAVSEQRMMTDLLVRLFCHTHTCHNICRRSAALLWLWQ